MTYYGSEVDREVSRIVDYWRARVVDACLFGVAGGFIAGALFAWWVVS